MDRIRLCIFSLCFLYKLLFTYLHPISNLIGENGFNFREDGSSDVIFLWHLSGFLDVPFSIELHISVYNFTGGVHSRGD